MWADTAKFFVGDGQDDMAEDDAAEGQRASKLAATCLTLAIGDFQSAASPGRFATKCQRNDCQQEANS